MADTTEEKPKPDEQDYSNEAILLRARERFPISEEFWQENHNLARDDDEFRNGKQWPERIARQRKADGRPCMRINRTESFIDQVVGDQRQNRPSIKVRPVDDESDTVVAEIYGGIIRNIEYISQAETIYDDAFDQSSGHGFGYFGFETDYVDEKSFDQEIRIRRIKNPYSVFFDPSAKKTDYSDARYCYVVERIPISEYKLRFPESTISNFDHKDTRYAKWLAKEEVMLAEYWERQVTTRGLVLLSNDGIAWKDELPKPTKGEDGKNVYTDEETGEELTIVKERDAEITKVWYCLINGVEILEKKEWAGKYIPIVLVFGKTLVLDGKVIYRGVIRWAKDPQRMLNYGRSASAEALALAPKAPWILTTEQVGGLEDDWKKANRKNLAYLKYKFVQGQPPPTRVSPATIATGAFTESKAAEGDLEATTGIYKANLGAPSNEKSGKAILARQREGDTGTFAYIDNLSRAIAQGGRILVDLIPKIYDTERIIRIRNLDDSERLVMINSPIEGDDNIKKYAFDGKPTKEDKAIFYDLAVGKYDVVVTTGPSYSTKRVEAADSMIQFVQAVPAAAAVMMDLLAKNMDWPGAEEISERLRKALPPGLAEPKEGEEDEEPQEPPPPTPEMIIEGEKLQLEKAKLEIEKMKAENEARKTEVEARKIELDAQQDDTALNERISQIAEAAAEDAIREFVAGANEGRS